MRGSRRSGQAALRAPAHPAPLPRVPGSDSLGLHSFGTGCTCPEWTLSLLTGPLPCSSMSCLQWGERPHGTEAGTALFWEPPSTPLPAHGRAVMGWPQFPGWLFTTELLAAWRGGLLVCWRPGAGAAFRMSVQHPHGSVIWCHLQSGEETCLLYHPDWSPVGHGPRLVHSSKGHRVGGGWQRLRNGAPRGGRGRGVTLAARPSSQEHRPRFRSARSWVVVARPGLWPHLSAVVVLGPRPHGPRHPLGGREVASVC